VERATIVARGLQLVERVVGRRTLGRAALDGAGTKKPLREWLDVRASQVMRRDHLQGGCLGAWWIHSPRVERRPRRRRARRGPGRRQRRAFRARPMGWPGLSRRVPWCDSGARLCGPHVGPAVGSGGYKTGRSARARAGTRVHTEAGGTSELRGKTCPCVPASGHACLTRPSLVMKGSPVRVRASAFSLL
jgi:hypothetical protein